MSAARLPQRFRRNLLLWTGTLLAVLLTLSWSYRQSLAHGESTAGKSVAPGSNVQFSVSEGTNFALALSPDGSTIAMDLQGRLWTLPANGGSATALTPVMSEARRPAWSADGEWIAFQYYAEYNWHIWVIRKDGSGLRQITRGMYDDREPQWLPDGRTIVFGSDRNRNFDLWSVDVQTGKLQQITRDDTEEYYPAPSPDGAKLAYVLKQGNTFSLVVREREGKEQVLVEKKDESLGYPRWSPDGRRIAFATGANYYGPGITSSLGVVDSSSGAVSQLSPDSEDVFPTGGSWVSDEELMYGADGHIKRRTLSGEGEQMVPFRASFTVARRREHPKKERDFTANAAHPVRGILRPVVSPDGKTIAFTALSDLWLLTIGDPTPRRLTHDAYLDLDATWSPDSTKLAYLSDRRGTGTMDLYIRDLATGEDRRLTETVDDLSEPAWSPDGRQIAVFVWDSKDWHAARLHLLDVATGEMRRINDGLFLPSTPSWSADGHVIAVLALHPSSDRERKGTNAFLMIDTRSKSTRFVSPDEARTVSARSQFGPIWSPDGKKIAYLHQGLLWTVSVDKQGNLIDTPRLAANEYAAYPSWAGDSAHLVYLSIDKLKRVSLSDGRIETLPMNLTWRNAVPSGRTVIQAGRVFDGISPNYQRDVDIVVDGNVITAIMPRQASWPRPTRVVDAKDKTVIPGLFQMHIHHLLPDGEKPGRLWLSFGITSVREPGADPYDALERKESWASAARIGPREFYSVIFEGSRVYYWNNMGLLTDRQVEMELDRALKLDYDFIKTYERMPFQLQKRVTQFAHAHGLTVSSHEIYPAATYGVDGVEHLHTVDRMEISDRLSPQHKIYEDALQIMAQSGMYSVPTVAGRAPGPSFIALMDAHPGILNLPQVQAFPPKYQQAAQRLMAYQRKVYGAQAKVISHNEQQAVRRMRDSGVTIGTGSDGALLTSGYSVILEIMHFAESGLGNFKALQAATIDSARIIGVDRYLGSIEAGKLADLVILNGDPLNELFDLFKVDAVVKDGQVYPLDELLRMPQGQQAAASATIRMAQMSGSLDRACTPFGLDLLCNANDCIRCELLNARCGCERQRP